MLRGTRFWLQGVAVSHSLHQDSSHQGCHPLRRGVSRAFPWTESLTLGMGCGRDPLFCVELPLE